MNVTEDHMDRYVDLEDYRQAKLRIYHNAEVGVLNNEDKLTFGDGENQAKQTVSFAENTADYWLKTENGKQYLMAKDEVILPCEEATLVGRHNYMNIFGGNGIGTSCRY